MIDPHHGVERRVHDEQRPAGRRHARLDIVAGHVVDERAPHVEGARPEMDLGLAVGKHAIERHRLELLKQMPHVGGRPDHREG
jgi:hypothetical protein